MVYQTEWRGSSREHHQYLPRRRLPQVWVARDVRRGGRRVDLWSVALRLSQVWMDGRSDRHHLIIPIPTMRRLTISGPAHRRVSDQLRTGPTSPCQPGTESNAHR